MRQKIISVVCAVSMVFSSILAAIPAEAASKVGVETYTETFEEGGFSESTNGYLKKQLANSWNIYICDAEIDSNTFSGRTVLKKNHNGNTNFIYTDNFISPLIEYSFDAYIDNSPGNTNDLIMYSHDAALVKTKRVSITGVNASISGKIKEAETGKWNTYRVVVDSVKGIEYLYVNDEFAGCDHLPFEATHDSSNGLISVYIKALSNADVYLDNFKLTTYSSQSKGIASLDHYSESFDDGNVDGRIGWGGTSEISDKYYYGTGGKSLKMTASSSTNGQLNIFYESTSKGAPEKAEISCDLYFESITGTGKLCATYHSGTNWGSTLSATAGGGEIDFYGVKIVPKNWYHFVFRYDGEGSAELFINGMPTSVITGKEAGLFRVQLKFDQGKTSGYDNIYLDNVCVTDYSYTPQIFESDKYQIIPASKLIKTYRYTTAETFLKNITTDDGCIMALKDASGEEVGAQSDVMPGMELQCIKESTGEVLDKYSIVFFDKQIDESFDDYDRVKMYYEGQTSVGSSWSMGMPPMLDGYGDGKYAYFEIADNPDGDGRVLRSYSNGKYNSNAQYQINCIYTKPIEPALLGSRFVIRVSDYLADAQTNIHHIARWIKKSTGTESGLIKMITCDDGFLSVVGTSVCSIEPRIWNDIFMYGDTETGRLVVYLNGVRVYDEINSHIADIEKFDQFRAAHQVFEENTISDAYIDNFEVYGVGELSDELISSVELGLSSEKYTVEGRNINGFEGDTVSDVKNNVVYPAGSSVRMYNSDKTQAPDSAAAETGMYLRLTGKDGKTHVDYLLDAAAYKAENGEITVNDLYGTEKFGVGKICANAKIKNYLSDPISLNVIIAHYSNSGRLLGVNLKNQNVPKGTHLVSAELDIDKSSGTYAKSFVFSDNLIPLCASKTKEGYGTGMESISFTYPGYVYKAVTFSFDDLNPNDITVMEIFKKYGIKATFNLMTSRFSNSNSPYTPEVVREQYSGFDTISHSYSHPHMYLTEATEIDGTVVQPMTYDEVIYEIDRSQQDMYMLNGQNTIGFVWPYHMPSERADFAEIMNHIKNDTSIKYARPIKTTGKFTYPSDWYNWEPTCHHDSLPSYLNLFNNTDPNGEMLLLSVWGHAVEFNTSHEPTKTKVRFDELEELCKILSEHSEIWKASNTEIYLYKTAVDNAVVDYNAGTVTNDSDLSIYAVVNGNKVEIKPHSVYSLNPTVVACWGDSLTYGEGTADPAAEAYPAVLSDLTGYSVENMGVGGETSTTIAARCGGVDMLLDEDITITADCSPVPITFSAYDKDGSYAGHIAPRDTSLGGWTPCTIAGVKGKLNIVINDTWPRTVKSATFVRNEQGEEIRVPKKTAIYPSSLDVMANADINIFFTGTNGGWDSENTLPNEDKADSLVGITDKMIERAKNKDKYIVIGLIRGGTNDTAKTDNALRTAYGEHYLNVKEYLASEQALTDAGITPTDEDLNYIAAGKIPVSLLHTDLGHLNAAGYRLMAGKVYEKMCELGYCE